MLVVTHEREVGHAKGEHDERNEKDQRTCERHEHDDCSEQTPHVPGVSNEANDLSHAMAFLSWKSQRQEGTNWSRGEINGHRSRHAKCRLETALQFDAPLVFTQSGLLRATPLPLPITDLANCCDLPTMAHSSSSNSLRQFGRNTQ